MIDIKRLGDLEYHRLARVGDGWIPPEEKSVVIVAENESKIIGRIFLVAPAHIEGVYVEEPWRGGTTFKRLVDAIELEARAEGIATLMAYAADRQMERYIERLGYSKMPFTVWKKELA